MEGKGEGEGSVKIFIHGTKARDTRIVNNLKRSRPPRHDFCSSLSIRRKTLWIEIFAIPRKVAAIASSPPEETIRNSIKNDSIDSREILKKKKKITYLWKNLKFA